MRKGVFVVFFLLATLDSSAQYGSYTYRNYKPVDGLPQSQVNIILEDKNGYLWIGTEGGGLARFDGREFKVYTTLDGLLSNIVIFLKLDQQQNLWIIHPRGITKFDGISFKRFQQPGAISNSKKLRKAFELGDSLFFISAPGHLGKIYKDSVHYWAKPVKPNVLVNYCHVTPDRKVIFYNSDSTFRVRTRTEDYIIRHKETFNRLFGLMFNHHGDVWLRTDSGYFNVDLERRAFVKVESPITNPIIFYDSLNDAFWTRSGNNVLRETIENGKVDVDTVLTDVNIRQVLVDAEGNTWLATGNSGLFKYFRQDFDRCSSDNLKAVMAIHKDSEGASWIGSLSKGLYKIKKGKIKTYSARNEPGRNSIVCIEESPAGEVFVGTLWGLGKYDRSSDTFKWFTRDEGMSNAAVMGLSFDPQGGLWIATHSGGVNYFDGKVFKHYTVKEGLSANSVTAIHYSQFYNKAFVGNEFGVSTIYDGRIEQLAIGGLENTTVHSIHPFKDSLLLIGSAGAGIAVFNPKTRFKRMITTHHGLASDFIYFVAADENNYVWIGSEKGITRLKLDGAFDIQENLHFDYDHGLEGVETNHNAYYLSEKEKYFGLIDGLYQFNDIPRSQNKTFDLHLTEIQLLDGQFSPREYADSLQGFFKIPVDPSLPPDQNHITFHFNRVDKRYPKSVKFKYFLENFDKTWSKPSSNTAVTYSNLPPGDYVFRVVSTNNEGSWSSRQLSYTFSVRTPFYQTASFIVGMLILLAGAITLTLYLRVKRRINQVMMLERIRVREQETLRKEIARDFHDEMGNQLTRIINYISLLKLNSNVYAGAEGVSASEIDLYTKVEDSAKYLYTGTRDFIWSIDPVNDELSKLFIHIRDFGEKLFEEKAMHFRAYNEVKENTKLPYGFSREANLIFKEAMTNAFKYSNAKNVTLSLSRTPDGYEMTLEDDGIGFSTGDVKKTNGLKNIRERADRIKATLRIQSVKNQGTKIVLNFKLNKTLKYGLAL